MTERERLIELIEIAHEVFRRRGDKIAEFMEKFFKYSKEYSRDGSV